MDTVNPADEVIYREGVEADLPAVAALYEKLDAFLRTFPFTYPEVEDVGNKWLEIFRRTLGRFSIVYVAEYQGQMVGFIMSRLKRAPDYLGGVMIGDLKDMWIVPEARRLGIGKKLLRMAAEWCWAQGVHSIEGQIMMDNEASFKLLNGVLGVEKELFLVRATREMYTPEPTQ